MFSHSLDILKNGRVHRYRVMKDFEPMGYADALDLWQHSESFRLFFNSLLANAPFSGYRWETPPVTLDTIDREFEFVLLDSPSLVQPPDAKTFASYFTAAEPYTGVVVFENLGKDALLVVPSPQADDSVYAHIGAFTRNGPNPQIHALWQTVGRTMQQRITHQPVWLSTEGHGVSWLHIRLDSQPKYYGFRLYRELA